MQINRLFEIIYILLHKEFVSASELAKQLGVSRRTICRDIDTLSLAGVPVYAKQGKGGGIGLLPDFVLSKSILSEQEQNEILSALHGLSNIKTSDTAQVLRKLSAIFNKTATNWIEVDFSGWHQESDSWGDFKTAILEQRVLEFDYFNSYGNKTFRRIEPIQLWFKSRSWYLKGFCLTKQGVRLYKLTRIKNHVVTGEHFDLRGSFTVLSDPIESREEQHEVTLKLRIDPEMTYRIYDDFNENEVEKQSDGSFIVSATLTEDNWVYGFLLSYGKHIEVLEPESIRNIIKEDARKILDKYS